MKAVGVPELAAWLDGRIGRDEAIARASRATRHYAKRQYTWFRHQMAGATMVGAQFSESLTPRIFPIVREFLLTHKETGV
jgi:tRNA dimethylallyltransferase